MIDYSVDAQGIATLEWNLTGRPQNLLNEASMACFAALMRQALDATAVRAVLIASAKADFIAGGDLEQLLGETSAQRVFDGIRAWHRLQREMETRGKPVAAALAGRALGGGFELALACHHRVAEAGARFGFPEVTLGLLPGAGGTQRAPRLAGIQAALPLLAEGRQIDADEALKLGLIHAVAAPGEARERARAWLLGEGLANPRQPWDTKGYRVPRGGPETPAGMQTFMAANALLREKSYGNYPAPRHILSCVYEGLATDIDTGLAIEARYFANLVVSPVAKNMIRTLFFGINAANKLSARPVHTPPQHYTKIGLLGAGMMGAGIAQACAAVGLQVALIDRSTEAAERGKAYCAGVTARARDKGKMSAQAAAALLARIDAGSDYAALEGAQLVIEAVFEDRALKAEVTRRAEAVLSADAIFASNTSTLPITGLALASARPANFIGLHFFSPAERMPLVEIIVGEATSPATVARAMDFVRAIGKTPVVVRDSRGFYTSRVFATYLDEGMAMLAEGVLPALIDRAGLIAGMPVGPLALADEVSLELVHRIAQQTRADLGAAHVERPADGIAAAMVEQLARPGKKAGRGFYDYPAQGRKRLWPGLATHFPARDRQPDVALLVERLIAIQSLEAARCLEEGVIASAADADVAAVLGWGYPPFRGGPIGWINTLGSARFAADCKRLAAAHGERFTPPAVLLRQAASGEALAWPREHDLPDVPN